MSAMSCCNWKITSLVSFSDLKGVFEKCYMLATRCQSAYFNTTISEICHRMLCRTARIWRCGTSTPLITFSTLHQQSKAPLAAFGGRYAAFVGSSDCGSRKAVPSRALFRPQAGRPQPCQQQQQQQQQQQIFLSDVMAARFFHMDEMVLVASGNSLHLYR
jgi:hypothetical protein